MRSVYAKILLWCIVMLVLTVYASFLVARYTLFRSMITEGPFAGANAAQAVDAAEAYESGGTPRLSTYLGRLRKLIPGEEYLTDARGKDLVSGRDWSWVLSEAHSDFSVPHRIGSNIFMVRKTPDDKYRLIVLTRPKFDVHAYLWENLLVLVGVAVLLSIPAMTLAKPLRQLARAVDRFGRGEFSVRVNSKRRDEIGDLARAYNQMAERIETLLNAERRLLQDISHELRSPLARLSFAAELTKTAEDRSAAAARVQKEVARLTSLVGALVQVTRMEGDPASANLEDVRLEPLLKELVEDCQFEAEAKDCRLTLSATRRFKCGETGNYFAAPLRTCCGTPSATRPITPRWRSASR